MKKVISKILLFLLGVVISLSPFGVFALVALNQKHIYSKTYYAALVDKVHNLQSHKNDKKIILIGGSNVAFGFNSKLIEEEFPEYKVVNFGLYAMLGTKIMMGLAIDYINKDDMVFIIPEINSQSTSLYFDAESTLKATEDDSALLWKLPEDNRNSILGKTFNYVIDRGRQKDIIEPSGVYQRKNFNEYGDILYEEKDDNDIPYRSTNRLILHYDPTLMVDYSYTIGQSFFDYVNEYNKKVTKIGAKLYYSFSPVNELSVVDKDNVSNYYWSIRNALTCNVVGNPNEYIIDPHYFYDSNFHLNDAGAVLRTYTFIKDIYRDIYLKSKTPKFDIPNKPNYVEINPEETEDDPNSIYFNFNETDAGYVISGLKQEAYNNKTIRLPKVYNHKYVIGISSHAFIGTSLEEITVPNSYHFFENGAFDSCPSLKKVYLETTNPSELIVDYLGNFINDAPNDFVIMVPNESLNSYKVDYNWQFYRNYLRGYDYEEN